jgi:hypothetical protein
MNATEKVLPSLASLPQPPAGAVFSLQKVEKISMPHPYGIGTKHVAVAARSFGGMLGEAAIEQAEREGASCFICQETARRGGRILKYSEHENAVTLFVKVPAGTCDLNAVEGLHKFLFDNKQTFIDAGIEGFAFPS